MTGHTKTTNSTRKSYKNTSPSGPYNYFITFTVKPDANYLFGISHFEDYKKGINAWAKALNKEHLGKFVTKKPHLWLQSYSVPETMNQDREPTNLHVHMLMQVPISARPLFGGDSEFQRQNCLARRIWREMSIKHIGELGNLHICYDVENDIGEISKYITKHAYVPWIFDHSFSHEDFVGIRSLQDGSHGLL